MFSNEKVAKSSNQLFFCESCDYTTCKKFNYDKIIESLKSYKYYCDSLGIVFVFLPCPDKESVYFEFVPFSKQSSTLLTLDSILCENNINTINSLAIFNKNKKKSLLYNYDDTHWSAAGVSLIAPEILKKYFAYQ